MARKIEVQIVGDSRSFERSLSRASASAGLFGASIAKLGKAAMVGGAALGAGATLGLGKAIKLASDYQAALNMFGAVSQATSAQMKQASALSIRLGADLTLPATSAKDAADAMTELSKAGLSVRDTLAAAKGVLQLSAAAQTDNATAATITANALNAFGLKGTEATKVADVLAAASVAASGTILDMADGLKYTSSTAAMAGISITDTVTAIAEMANKGIQGGEAGAALQQMLLRLEAPTKKASASLKDMGIQIYDAGGKMRPIRSLIDQFTKATSGMSDAQRNAALGAIFGARAIRAANIVLLGGTAAFDNMRAAVDRSGAAADVAKAQMAGFKGALEGLRSTAETLGIQIGLKLLPAATTVVRGISGLLSNLSGAQTFRAKLNVLWDFGTSIADSLQRAWSGANIATVAGRNTSGAGMAAGLQGQITQAFQTMNWAAVGMGVVDGITKAITAGGNIAKKLAAVLNDAVRSVNWIAFGRAAGPGLATAVAAAIAAALDPAFWVKNWDLALAIGTVFFGGAIAKVAGKLGALFGARIGAAFADGVAKVATVLERLSPRLATAFVAGMERVPGLLGALFGKLTGLVGGAFGRLSKLAQFTLKVLGVDALINTVGQAVRAVIGKLQQLVGWVSGTFGGLLRVAAIASGLTLVAGLISGLAGLVPKVVAKLSQIAGAISSVAKSAAGWAAGIGRAIVDGVVSGATGLGGRLGAKLKSEALGALRAARDAIIARSPSRLAASMIGLPIAEGIIVGFQQGIVGFGRTLQSALTGALNVSTPAALANLDRLAAKWTAYGQALTPVEAKLKALQDAETRRSQAEAVSSAMSDLAKARQIKNAGDRNTAVLQAEESLRQAQLTVTTARLDGLAAAERASTDRRVAAQLAAIDRMRTQVTARTDALGAAFTRLQDYITRAFGAKTQQMLDTMSAKFDRQIQQVRDWQTGLTDAEKALAAFDQAGGGGLTPAEQQIQTINASEGERQRSQSLASAQAELAKARAVADVQERAAAVAAAEEQVRQAQLAITLFGLQQQADLERSARDADLAAQRAALQQAADQSRVARDNEAAAQIAALEAAKTAELANLTELRRQQEEQMTLQLAALQAQLVKHPAAWKATNAKIIALLATYGVDLRKSGALLGDAFAGGLESAQAGVGKAARALAETAARFLRLKSPAAAGPLSTLDRWFAPLPAMLAAQMNPSGLAAAAGRLAAAAVPAPTFRPLAAVGGGAGGGFGAGGGNTYNINVNGTVMGDDRAVRDLTTKIRVELQRISARNS